MTRWLPGRRPPSVVGGALLRFTALSVTVLALLALVTYAFAHWLSFDEARHTAELRTSSFTRLVAAPLMTPEFRTHPEGTPLETALDSRVADATVVHVVVWDEQGDAIWSDREGSSTHETPTPQVAHLLGTEGVWSTFTDDMHAERDEEHDEHVLEVYAAGVDTAGAPFLMEWYWPTSNLDIAANALLLRLLPLTLGSLLVFQLLVLPLANALGRRVEAERNRLTGHALEVQQLERRRVIERLHDGVVQDLGGVRFALRAVSDDLPDAGRGRRVLAQADGLVGTAVTSLRRLLTDLYPPDLSGAGLETALQDLAARTSTQGTEVEVSLRGEVEQLPTTSRMLVHRIVGEGLRNAVKHAGGGHALVVVEHEQGQATVTVRDDGPGPAPGAAGADHVGLRLLGETVRELGGGLTLAAAPGGGAQLVVTFRSDASG